MTGRLLVLSMGVNDYEDARFEPLRFAASDAAAVHTRLGMAAREPRLTRLLPPAATATEVLCAIREMLSAAKVRRGDRLVLYFAGHGRPLGTQPPDQLLLLSRADAALLDDDLAIGNDVLSVRTLLSLLDRWPIEALMILDTCNRSASSSTPDSESRTIESVLAGLATRSAQYSIKPKSTTVPYSKSSNGLQIIISTAGVSGVAHEAAALGGGFFARTFCRWLEAKVLADEPALVDETCLVEWGATIIDEGRTVGLNINQRPWMSNPMSSFLIYAPLPRRSGDPAPSLPALLQVHEAWHPELKLVDLVLPNSPEKRPTRLAVGRDPITVGQWLGVMGCLPLALENTRPDLSAPVTAVDLRACNEFALRLTKLARARLGSALPSFRLLQTEEWVTLCRSGMSGKRCGHGQSCGKPTLDSAVFRWSDLGAGGPRRRNPSKPLSVDDPRNSTNALGLRGLRGNVREWTVTPRSSASGGRVIGGSFMSPPDELSCGYWIDPEPGGRALTDVGFRIVRAANTQEMRVPLARMDP